MRNNHHPARVGKQSSCVGIGSHMRGITVSQLFETVVPPPWHWALKRSITGLQIVLVPLGVVGYAMYHVLWQARYSGQAALSRAMG